MFNLETLLAPLFRYVRNATRQGLHQAFQAGAQDFTDDLAGLVQERHVIDHASLTRQLLLGTAAAEDASVVAMPAAAQVTKADDAPSPALDVPLYERAREMLANGMSQRETARQLNVPESTLRGWLKRDQG